MNLYPQQNIVRVCFMIKKPKLVAQPKDSPVRMEWFKPKYESRKEEGPYVP